MAGPPGPSVETPLAPVAPQIEETMPPQARPGLGTPGNRNRSGDRLFAAAVQSVLLRSRTQSAEKPHVADDGRSQP